MLKQTIFLTALKHTIVLLGFLALGLSAGEDRVPKPGDAVDPFKATDADGKPVDPFAPGAKAVVLAFTSIHCPVATVQTPRLAELESKYKDKGSAFSW